MVNLNPKEGLAEEMRLKYKELEFTQTLDYEHMPFRCHQCHKYGHLAKDFLLGHRRIRKQKRINRGPFRPLVTEEPRASEGEMMEGVDGIGGVMTETDPTGQIPKKNSPIAMEQDPERPPTSSPFHEAEVATSVQEGMILVSYSPLFPCLCTFVFSCSKPGPSRPSQMEYMQMQNVIKSLESIITSIPVTRLEAPLMPRHGSPPP